MWRGALCATVALVAAELVSAQQSARIGEAVEEPGFGLDSGGSAGVRPRLNMGLAFEQTFSDMQERTTLPNGFESITRLDPYVRFSSRSGRVQGHLNYAGNYYYRTGREDSDGSEWQNYLDASFLAEAVPGWAYLDVRASIQQQAISAFGQPVGNNRLSNANRTEVSTLWLSPYLTGVVGNLANYELRVIGSASSSSAEGTTDSRYGAGLASLASENRGPLGWRMAAKTEWVEYSNSSAPSTTHRALGALFWTPNSDLRFQVNAGYENADLGGPVNVEHDNYGLGFEWTPSPRTRVAANFEERYFGRAHSVQVEYRTPQSVFTYSDTRNVNEGGIDPFNLGQPSTLYDLLFAQFATIAPDPVQREQLVLNYLTLIGRDPNEMIYGGQLITGVTVQRNQFLGWVLSGRRMALSLQAFRTESELVDVTPSGSPTTGQATIETGYSAALSYRLSPDMGVSLFGSRRMTDATSTQGGTEDKSLALALTSRLGRRTTGSLGLRHTVYDSPTDPYRATELIGRIRFDF